MRLVPSRRVCLLVIPAVLLAHGPESSAQDVRMQVQKAPARAVEVQKPPTRAVQVPKPQRAVSKIQPVRRASLAGNLVRRAPASLSGEEEVDILSYLGDRQRAAIARGAPGALPPPPGPATPARALKADEPPYMARIENTSDIHQHARFNHLLPEVLTGLGYCTEAIAGACYPMDEEDPNKAARLMPLDMCGPSSMANNIVFLAQTRFPQLTTDSNLEVAGYKAAFEIGVNAQGNRYSNVGGFQGLITRTEGYLHKRGVRPSRIRVIAAIDRSADVLQRTSPFDPAVPATFQIRPPTLADLKAAIRDDALVTTLWGFYGPAAENAYGAANGGGSRGTQLAKAPDWLDYWDRNGGHWVAAVGYGETGAGKDDDSVIVYHNSAGSDRRNRKQQYVSYQTVVDYPTNPMLTLRVDAASKADTSLCPELDGQLVFCRARANGMLIAGPPPRPEDEEITLLDGVVIFDFD